MFKHDKVLWITRTALFLALLVILQWATVPLGNNFITGSIVNMMLILSVMINGIASGLAIAAVSPILPTMLGFGPIWPIVPFISAGNMALVTLWYIIGNRGMHSKYIAYVLALVAAALAKFSVLYFGIVKLAIPYLFNVPGPQAAVMSMLFSYPQIITASIGGALAIVLLPPLMKAIDKS